MKTLVTVMAVAMASIGAAIVAFSPEDRDLGMIVCCFAAVVVSNIGTAKE